MVTMRAQAGVTIAIPNWNHEILLPRAITSALRAVELLGRQGVPAEVLVIDDCSRDGSQTLLRQLEALHYRDGLRCLAFGANAGLAASRNQALDHARYRYLAFLDADNELIPENLPQFVRALDQTGAAVAYGNLLVRSPTGDHAHHALSNESIQKKLFRYGSNYVDAFSIWDRLQLRDVGGYDASLQALEDHEMWLHLATNGRQIVFVPAVLGYYYILPAAMSRDSPKQESTAARLVRIFNQLGAREFLHVNTCHIMYHPDLGYL
jgi:glycosyltransferase involved in cell wall biosynthesis